jgi:hypothetical protein
MGIQQAVRDQVQGSPAKLASYGAAATLGALGGGLLGSNIGRTYGTYGAGESPHYRDVLRKEILWGILGALSGAAIGAGASVGTKALLERRGGFR